MRALAFTACAAFDRARRHPDAGERKRNQALVDLLTPIVKGWCTEQGVEVASIGVQVHGGMGFVEDTGAAQYLRDARITTIYEGTTGIQANDLVGRKTAFEQGATAKVLIAEMRGLDAPLARLGDDFKAARANFTSAIASLEAATRWVVDTYRDNPNAVAAVAVPYLKLFGTVAGAWVMMKAAIRASEMRADPQSDTEFLSAKMAAARFYAEHILPQAQGHAGTVINGSASVLALAEEQF
jgi:hypothetical protein